MADRAPPDNKERSSPREPAGRLLKLVILFLALIAVGQTAVVILVGNFLIGPNIVTGDENSVLIGVAFALLAIVGALAAMGQPRNAVGWVLLFTGLAVGMAGVGETFAYYMVILEHDRAGGQFFSWLGGFGWYSGLILLFIIFPFLFPDGRPPGRGWRVVLAAAILFALIFLAAYLLLPRLTSEPYDVATIESRLAPVFWALPFFLVLGILSLVVRYRRAGVETRQQMKWLMLTMATPLAFFALSIILEDRLGLILSNFFWGVLYLLFPLGLGVALLRFRMFNVDAIIRKTAVYGVLTALLGLIYFGVVIILQRLLAPITGESAIAVVLSTLLIAALFLPLRRRVQAAIDRRFYRRKYDAEKVLAQFATTARDETDLDALTAELLRVIQETMEPEHVSLWLKAVSDGRRTTKDD